MAAQQAGALLVIPGSTVLELVINLKTRRSASRFHRRCFRGRTR
jgi:hypothetical protein